MAEASAPTRVRGKSAAAFRTISEVAEELDLPQHVLRFWETRFNHVKPVKRAGGRRYYRPEDVDLLRRIRDLLYKDGYTIKGVQKLLRQRGGKALVESMETEEPTKPDGDCGAGIGESERTELKKVLADLVELRGMLKRIR